MQQERVYDADWKKYTPLKANYQHKFTNQQTNPCHICIIANNKMDGQKSIWLQQLRYLSSSDQIFNFTFFLTNNMDDTTHTFYYHLKSCNATVFFYPLSTYNEVTVQVLDEDPLDGTRPISQYWVNRNFKKLLVSSHYI